MEDIAQIKEVLLQFEQDFKLVVNNIPAVVFKGYADGSVEFFDQKVEDMTGFPLADFNNKTVKWTELIMAEDVPETRRIFGQALKSDKKYVREYRITHKEGNIIWVQERSHIVLNPEGRIDYVSGIFFDITDRKLLESEVDQRNAQLEEANTRLASWAKELEKRNEEIRLLSQMGDLLQGCQSMEEAYPAIGKYLARFFPQDSGALLVLSASRNLVEAAAMWGEVKLAEEIFGLEDCWGLRRGRPHFGAEDAPGLACRHVHGRKEPYFCVPMMAHGEALGVLHVMVGQHEAGQLSAKQQLALSVGEHLALALATLKLQETLRHMSFRDALTDLYNRRYMQENLEREMRRAERQGSSIGVILIDIDHFKRFNDVFGHDAGDAVLRELGRFMRKHVRGSDIACRYGGEEFVLILPGISQETAQGRAEQLRAGVKRLQLHHGAQSLDRITLSLGVALYPEHGASADEVLRAADKALYQAKQGGRD